MVVRPEVRSVVIPFCCVLAFVGTNARSARAAVVPGDMDAPALVQMEARANLANPREKCYLYAEVLAGLTELEGRQIAAGENEQAHSTMQHMNDVAGKIHAASVGDAKRLKNAEQIIERTTRRVADMVRVAGAEEQTAMQSTLQHMTTVHNEILAMVFSH
jgi:hypothetical protein